MGRNSKKTKKNDPDQFMDFFTHQVLFVLPFY